MLKQIEIGHAGQKWQHMVALITAKKETQSSSKQPYRQNADVT